MKKYLVENYTYEGLGFPIELHEVELVEWQGEMHPKIDVRKVAEEAFQLLLFRMSQKKSITLEEAKFVSNYIGSHFL